MGLVIGTLSGVLRKRPRVTFEKPSLKRQRPGKEVVVAVDEPMQLESVQPESVQPETTFEVGQSSAEVCKDIEVDPISVRHDLLEKRRKARKFLERQMVAVPLPNGVVTYVDRSLYESFQFEHEEDMFWWCLDQYEDDTGRFIFEMDMLQYGYRLYHGDEVDEPSDDGIQEEATEAIEGDYEAVEEDLGEDSEEIEEDLEVAEEEDYEEIEEDPEEDPSEEELGEDFLAGDD